MKSYAMNGAGNAFVLIDARGRSAPLSLPAERVAAIHARHAFDQLLTLETHPVETALLRVWNSDGGEVGACGNGARAAAWLLFEQDGGETLSMSSRGGGLTARRLEDGLRNAVLGQPVAGARLVETSAQRVERRLHAAERRALGARALQLLLERVRSRVQLVGSDASFARAVEGVAARLRAPSLDGRGHVAALALQDLQLHRKSHVRVALRPRRPSEREQQPG